MCKLVYERNENFVTFIRTNFDMYHKLVYVYFLIGLYVYELIYIYKYYWHL